MLIQIHMLQNYAPSNLNRDDTGAPKTAMFGGHRRGRISSQCIKRSIRTSPAFAERFSADNLLAVRTKRLPMLVDSALREMEVENDVREDIVERIPEIGRKASKSGPSVASQNIGETRQLIFVGSEEARKLARALHKMYKETGPSRWKELSIDVITKAIEPALPMSVDIAMFGRMTTTTAFQDVSAAVQVAHALSVHKNVTELDFYTAVDDLAFNRAEGVAGMIGEVEFNSCTYYKYLNIHWEQLVDNLRGDREVALRAVTSLIEAASISHPSGKQNGFAAPNLPDFVMIDVGRRNIPVSYANAFLTPVPSRSDSMIDTAIDMLDKYATTIRETYGLKTRSAYFSLSTTTTVAAHDAGGLVGLQNWVVEQVRQLEESQSD